MAKYEEQNRLDYRQGGDTVDEFAQKYMSEITRVFMFLNDLKSNSINTAEGTEPTAGQWKVEDGNIYMRNTENTAWVLLGKLEANFGFKDAMETFISTRELPLTKVDDVNNIDFSKILTTDNLTSTAEVGKIPFVGANGLLPVSIAGNAGMIAGIKAEVDNLTDGQVLTFRRESNTWHNENKGTIGDGKALALYAGSTLLAEYDGSVPVSADITAIADQHLANHNVSSTAHADIRSAIPTRVSQLTNDRNYTSIVSTISTTGSGNAITNITCNNGAFTATKGATFLTSHQNISGKADKQNITAGTIGQTGNTSGTSITIPYTKVNSQGLVTGYGTKVHTVTGLAPTNSPNLTGKPLAPTAAVGSNDNQIATTYFVQNALGTVRTNLESSINGLNTNKADKTTVNSLSSTVSSLSSNKADKTTVTSLTNTVGTKADKLSITAGTAGTASATSTSGNSLAIPYVSVNNQGLVTGYGTHTHTFNGFAPIVSPNLTGTPTAPTASATTNNTQIATTAFVQTISNKFKGSIQPTMTSIMDASRMSDRRVNTSLGHVGYNAGDVYLTQPYTNYDEIRFVVADDGLKVFLPKTFEVWWFKYLMDNFTAVTVSGCDDLHWYVYGHARHGTAEFSTSTTTLFRTRSENSCIVDVIGIKY